MKRAERIADCIGTIIGTIVGYGILAAIFLYSVISMIR